MHDVGVVLEPSTFAVVVAEEETPVKVLDRKSTRLNSSHLGISYAVFCLKKKKYYGVPGSVTRCDYRSSVPSRQRSHTYYASTYSRCDVDANVRDEIVCHPACCFIRQQIP